MDTQRMLMLFNFFVNFQEANGEQPEALVCLQWYVGTHFSFGETGGAEVPVPYS